MASMRAFAKALIVIKYGAQVAALAVAPRTMTCVSPPSPKDTVTSFQPAAYEAQWQLNKRDQITSSTCGWTSQDVSSPWACPLGLACAYWGPTSIGAQSQEPGGNVAVCCPYDAQGNINWGDCPGPTACMNYNATASASSHIAWIIGAEESATWDYTVFCGASYPACATASVSGGVCDGCENQQYTSIYCTDVSTVIDVYLSPTNSLSATSSSTSSTAPQTSAPVVSARPHHDPSTLAGSTTIPASSGGQSNSGGSSNTAAIAGGTVGGVIGLAAIGAALGYAIWSRKYDKKHKALPEVQAYQAYPPGSHQSYSSVGHSSVTPRPDMSYNAPTGGYSGPVSQSGAYYP